MSYPYEADPVGHRPFNDVRAHAQYSTAPVANPQNQGHAPVAQSQNSFEIHSQPPNYPMHPNDCTVYQQQAHYNATGLAANPQWWNFASRASPPSTTTTSDGYVNSQAALGQLQHNLQCYSVQNPEYHPPSHPHQRSQHTVPTPTSSVGDNALPETSYQTLLPSAPYTANDSQNVPASFTNNAPNGAGTFVGGYQHHRQPSIPFNYDERPAAVHGGFTSGEHVSPTHQQMAPMALVSNFQPPLDNFQSSWMSQQASHNSSRSSSLANALGPPATPPTQRDRLPIKHEDPIAPQSHSIRSGSLLTSSPSQSIGSQATIYPVSSSAGSSNSSPCHVAVQRPRPTQPPMPSSSGTIQIPKLHSSSIKQFSTSPPSKQQHSASPPSQWSSPGRGEAMINDLQHYGKNVGVMNTALSSPPRVSLMNDGAPNAYMATAAAVHAHFPVPPLEQAASGKPVSVSPYHQALPNPGAGWNDGKMLGQVAAGGRSKTTLSQLRGASGQHYSPYAAAKEQRDGRKLSVSQMAEMHAANIAAAGLARGGTSVNAGLGPNGLGPSAVLYPSALLHAQHQLPQTIAIGAGAAVVAETTSAPSTDAEDEGKREGKFGKKPFLACEFCRRRKIACGKGPTIPADIVVPPGPRTCNQCFRRGIECQFPEASRRGLRHGKPSRRVIYGENNEYRIVDPEEEDYYDDDDEEYYEEEEHYYPPTKGKGKAVPARPWSPIRFVPAVDTEILKDLSRRGIIEKGGYA